MRVLLRALRWLLVGVVILLVAVVVFTQTAIFRHGLRDRLVDLVNESVRGQIEVGAVEGTIFTHLVLRDLRVLDEGEEILAVPGVRVDLSPSALLTGRLDIARVEIDAPVIRLRQDAEGQWNLAEAFAPLEPILEPAPEADAEAAALPLAIEVRSLALSGGRVEITVAGEPPATYAIDDLAIDAAIRLGPGGIDAEVSRIEAVLRADGAPELRASGSLVYRESSDPAYVEVKSLEVETDASSLSFVARIDDLERPRIGASLTVDRIATADLAALIDGWPLVEDLSGDLRLDGDLADLRAKLRLAAGEATIAVEASADVSGDDPVYDVQAELRQADAAALAPSLGVAGVAEVTARVAGRGTEIAAMRATGDVAARGVEVAEIRVGDVTATVGLEGGTLALEGAIVGAGRAEVEATLEVAAERYDLRVRTEALEIAAIAGEEAPFEARLNLDARVTGRGFSPADMDTSVNVDVRPSRIGPVAIDAGRIAARMAGERLEIQEARLDAAGASVRVSGELGVGEDQNGHLDYEARVPDLEPWLRLVDQEGGGSVHLWGKATGSVANLETSGTLDLADVVAGGARIRSGDLRYDASGLGGSRPSADATVSLRGLDAGVEMRSVRAEVRLAPEDPPEVRIDVAAVTVEERTQSLGASVQVGTEETTVLVDVLSLDVPGGQWRLAAPARIVQRPERIVVSGLRLANGEESIEIEGGLAEAGGEELRLRASGVSLSVANEFAPDEVEDIDGTVDADLRITGTLSQPEPSGSVALRGGKATIRPLGLAMSEVTVEVEADPRRIELTTLSARAGEGSLEASGTVLLEEGALANVDLRLGLDRWPAIRTQQMEATVAGSVTASGPASGPAVAGRIDVVRAVLRPGLSMLDGGGPSPRDPTIIVLQERVDGEDGSEGATADGAVEAVDAMRDLSLDLRVAIERDAWVRHPMAGLELSGTIDLRKRPRDELLVTGQVRVVRGWIYFQGRRFTPTKGEVTFTGGDQVDPSLDIELQTRVAAYTIDAAVGGTASEPSLELRSEPRLEEADILALLMFGKPVNNLDQGEEVALQQQAQNMAANLAAGQVGQAVSDSLGLGIDIQEIDVATGRVALGRYLTPQTYVSVAQELAGRGGQQVTVDYYVTPRWTLRTTADSTGNNGADVFWRLEY